MVGRRMTSCPEVYKNHVVILTCGDKASYAKAIVESLKERGISEDKIIIAESESDAMNAIGLNYTIQELTMRIDSHILDDMKDIVTIMKKEERQKSQQQIANMRRYHNRRK